MRVGEVGQEVLGERCRDTNQTPRTSAPSQDVLEPSRGKQRNGSRRARTLVGGEVRVLHPGGVDGDGGGGEE